MDASILATMVFLLTNLLLNLLPLKCSFSGHAGAMLQARRLGKHLLVGVHSDADIMENKGPTVMSLKERSVYKTEILRLTNPVGQSFRG